MILNFFKKIKAQIEAWFKRFTKRLTYFKYTTDKDMQLFAFFYTYYRLDTYTPEGVDIYYRLFCVPNPVHYSSPAQYNRYFKLSKFLNYFHFYYYLGRIDPFPFFNYLIF
jgi:hypothetical protein